MDYIGKLVMMLHGCLSFGDTFWMLRQKFVSWYELGCFFIPWLGEGRGQAHMEAGCSGKF